LGLCGHERSPCLYLGTNRVVKRSVTLKLSTGCCRLQIFFSKKSHCQLFVRFPSACSQYPSALLLTILGLNITSSGPIACNIIPELPRPTFLSRIPGSPNKDADQCGRDRGREWDSCRPIAV